MSDDASDQAVARLLRLSLGCGDRLTTDDAKELIREIAEARSNVTRAIASTKEQCARVAEARAAEGEYGTWQAQEGLIIAADIRSLPITATPNPKRE